jgi:Ca2+-binding RTX toxin-like protein
LRRLSSIPLTAALLLCAFTGTAGSQGQIVLHGAGSGSHLRLRVDGSRLEVTGQLARRGNVGCKITRRGASCGLSKVGMIVVETGPANDKVEVLDRLPVPLTAYLGAGSDKLIGSAEADTCYPQQTPRNRCIGGAGKDACISGPVNTDCVGEGGDDFCQTHGGSDGCWGGPGDDTCLMGRGEDGCHGEGGNDRLYGGAGPDRLYGGAGTDHCNDGPQPGRSAECETILRR